MIIGWVELYTGLDIYIDMSKVIAVQNIEPIWVERYRCQVSGCTVTTLHGVEFRLADDYLKVLDAWKGEQ